jgi:hypothetical protein
MTKRVTRKRNRRKGPASPLTANRATPDELFEVEAQPSPRPPFALPPVTESRLGLPVRFPGFWTAEPPDEFAWDLSEHDYWPAELWEVFYVTLWRAIAQRHPGWATRFRAAWLAEVLRPSFAARNVPQFLDRTARFRGVRKGPRKGSRRVPRGLLLKLYPRFLRILTGKRTRRSGYASDTLRTIEGRWERAAEDLEPPPKQPFPRERLQKDLAQNEPPAHIARVLLAAWFGVTPDTIRVYIKRFRKAIPKHLRVLAGL